MNAVPMYGFEQGGPSAGSAYGEHRSSARLVDAHAKTCQKNFAIFIHATAFAASFFAIPVLFPFLIWIFKKNECPFIDDHGREQMNFQLSFILMSLICVILAIPTLGLAALFYLFYLVVSIIAVVRSMIAASNGEYFRYPMTIRLIPS